MSSKWCTTNKPTRKPACKSIRKSSSKKYKKPVHKPTRKPTWEPDWQPTHDTVHCTPDPKCYYKKCIKTYYTKITYIPCITKWCTTEYDHGICPCPPKRRHKKLYK